MYSHHSTLGCQSWRIFALCSLLILFAAEASAFERSVSRTRANGQTSTKSVTANRTANGYTRDTTVTGPQGNTATRSAQGTWDPSTKTWTKTVTTNGGN